MGTYADLTADIRHARAELEEHMAGPLAGVRLCLLATPSAESLIRVGEPGEYPPDPREPLTWCGLSVLRVDDLTPDEERGGAQQVRLALDPGWLCEHLTRQWGYVPLPATIRWTWAHDMGDGYTIHVRYSPADGTPRMVGGHIQADIIGHMMIRLRAYRLGVYSFTVTGIDHAESNRGTWRDDMIGAAVLSSTVRAAAIVQSGRVP